MTGEKVAIVIPTYNEKDNIVLLIKKIFYLLPDVKIIVVDDSSPDGTAEFVSDLRKIFSGLSLLVRQKKEGLGRAYSHGFEVVLRDQTVEKVIMMDADFSHDPLYLPELIRAGKEADVVVGSRYVPGGSVFGWERWRKFLSLGGNFYSRLVTRLPVVDCTGGFNLIRASILKKIIQHPLDASGYAFQIELKFRLWKIGASFIELPILFRNRINGESKISNHIIKEGIFIPWKLLLKK